MSDNERFKMHMRFSHSRFSLRVQDKAHYQAFHWRCNECDFTTDEVIITETVMAKPEMLMYPDKHIMGQMSKHDMVHKPPAKPKIIEVF